MSTCQRMSDSMHWDELTNIREGKGLSVAKLAQLSGISHPTLGIWETNMPPQILRMKKLCDVLDVTPNELLGYSVCVDDRTKDGTTVVSYEGFTIDELKELHEALSSKIDAIRQRFSKTMLKIDIADVERHNCLVDLQEKIEDAIAKKETS